MLTRAALLVGAGSLVDAAIGLWASKFISTLIYGLQPRDLTTLAVSAGVLMVVAGCATWVPARRAIRTDPATILGDM